jgi:hypothetical protein
MIRPLRLRLYIPAAVGPDETCLLVTTPYCVRGPKGEETSVMARLEFENPINGTWHPVEIVDDYTTKSSPAESDPKR